MGKNHDDFTLFTRKLTSELGPDPIPPKYYFPICFRPQITYLRGFSIKILYNFFSLNLRLSCHSNILYLASLTTPEQMHESRNSPFPGFIHLLTDIDFKCL